MGEYLTDYTGQTVLKLGTMDDMRYVRRSEVESFAASGKYPRQDLRYILQDENSLYRFPFPVEDNATLEQINERNMFKTTEIPVSKEFIQGLDHGDRYMPLSPVGIQHAYNVNIWIPCPCSKDFNLRKSTNGAFPLINIYGERYDSEGNCRTIFRCAWCEHPFSLSSDEIEYIKAQITSRWSADLADRIHANKAFDLNIAESKRLITKQALRSGRIE